MSIREMARLAGVSPSTVSRILNDPDKQIPFAPKTRQRIIELCREKNYQPNVHAKRLFAGRSHVLAVVVPPLSWRKLPWSKHNNSYFTQSLAGIEQQSTLHDHDLLLVTNTEQFIERQKFRTLFTSRAIDGMLIWGSLQDEPYINDLFDEKYPLVTIGPHQTNTKIPHVGVDDQQAGVRIAKHFIELGHQHVAYLTGLQEASPAIERRDAFCQTCKNNNVQVTVRDSEFSYTSGYELTQQILKQKNPPTAIGTANDIIAVGVLEAAIAQGLQVPKDLSVASLEQQMPFYNPRLTTIEMPIYDTGIQGAKLLIQLIEDHINGSASRPQQQHFLPVTFVQGQTTGPAPPAPSPPPS